MLISDQWLKDYFDSQLDPNENAAILTDLGLEVEGVTTYESIKGGLDGVVVGEVLECDPHPNADRLKITRVSAGKETLQIICGAPNVAKGQKVAVALVGTTIYPSNGEPITLKKTKIRGESSEGMLCAEDELGLGQSHDGIMVLDPDLKPGQPLSTVFENYSDTVYEIGLTPNRADAMGHYGVARDLRAGIAKNNQLAPLNTVSTSSFSIENYSTPIEITVQSQEKAPRYLGIVVSDIRVAPSPAWLQHRLKAIGLNPINNVVDCTNYILHGLGQPLHAFDYDKIEGKKVVVRTAEKGEKLLTLDGVERELHTEDLVICDSKKPMCIAGVFGGLHSGVTENTTSVLIESAYFDPVSVRKTSKRHGLHTDASFRFERGVDINTCEIALKRAAIILKEIAGGTVSSDLIESYPKEAEPISLFLNYATLNRIAGTELPKDHVKNILVHLEFKVLNETEAGLGIVVPTYRNDVTREIDVIEEVFRVYGYNNIPIPEKFSYTHASSAENQNLKFQNEVSDHLVASGYVETLSNSLTLASNDSRSILLKNALSSDLESLRTEMFSSGLKTLAYNANRQQKDLKIFEFGKVYHQEGNERREQQQLLIMATGRKHIQHWLTGDEHISFYDLKSICATLLHRLEISDYSEQNLEAHSFFDEGISLSNDKLLAEIGVVSKEYSKSFGLTQDVVSILIYWDNVIQNAHKKEFDLNEITKHPQVYRDLALILDENIKFGQLLEACHKAESKLLKGVRLFDVYTGKGVPSNKKSYAIQLQFNDSRKTLTDKEIDKSVSKIFKKLESDFGAVLRS